VYKKSQYKKSSFCPTSILNLYKSKVKKHKIDASFAFKTKKAKILVNSYKKQLV